MSGRRTQFDTVGVGLRPLVGDALSGLVRPLGAFERVSYQSEQKSTEHASSLGRPDRQQANAVLAGQPCTRRRGTAATASGTPPSEYGASCNRASNS
jgi:hypothetical protein